MYKRQVVGPCGQSLLFGNVPEARAPTIGFLPANRLLSSGDQQRGLSLHGRGKGQAVHDSFVPAQQPNTPVPGVENGDGPHIQAHGIAHVAHGANVPRFAEPRRAPNHGFAGRREPDLVLGEGHRVDRPVQTGADGHTVGGDGVGNESSLVVDGPDTNDLVPARRVQRLAIGAEGQGGDVRGGAFRFHAKDGLLVPWHAEWSVRRPGDSAEQDKKRERNEPSGETGHDRVSWCHLDRLREAERVPKEDNLLSPMNMLQ